MSSTRIYGLSDLKFTAPSLLQTSPPDSTVAEAQPFLQRTGDGLSPSSGGNRVTYVPRRYVLYVDSH